MRPGRLYGKLRPGGGVEIGLRRETENGNVYASLFVQSMASGVSPCGTWLTKTDAKKLVSWLKEFLKDEP